jgi:hypothetical protein
LTPTFTVRPHPLAAAVLRLVLSAAQQNNGDSRGLSRGIGSSSGDDGVPGEDSMVPLLVEMSVRGGVLGDAGDSTGIDLARVQAAHVCLS